MAGWGGRRRVPQRLRRLPCADGAPQPRTHAARHSPRTSRHAGQHLGHLQIQLRARPPLHRGCCVALGVALRRWRLLLLLPDADRLSGCVMSILGSVRAGLGDRRVGLCVVAGRRALLCLCVRRRLSIHRLHLPAVATVQLRSGVLAHLSFCC